MVSSMSYTAYGYGDSQTWGSHTHEKEELPKLTRAHLQAVIAGKYPEWGVGEAAAQRTASKGTKRRYLYEKRIAEQVKANG